MLSTMLSILILGDSISLGISKEFKEIIPKNIIFHNISKVGAGLNNRLYFNFYEKAEEANKNINPDIIIIIIGANDEPCRSYYEKCQELISKFPNKKIFWVSVPVFGHSFLHKRTEKNNYIIKKLMGENFLDINPIITINEQFTMGINNIMIRSSDKVHFTNKGYRILAKEILKQLNEKGTFQ